MKIKLEETHEMEVTNRIWALPMDRVINVNNYDCIYRAPLTGGMNPHDIRYPCYLCGPTSKGISCARDLMRHSDVLCSHDLFPSKVEQGKHYICDGRDLTQPTQEQYERYSDGSHRGTKKLEGNERAETKKKLVEVRTKARENAKKGDGASTSTSVDVGEFVRRRKAQLAVQKDVKAKAKKREELLKKERTATEKKIQLEEQQKAMEEKKRRVKEEWQRKLKLAEAEEERKREDMVQFDKSLAKTLAIEGNVFTGKKSVRRDLTSKEFDNEFRELNAAQLQVNARLVVEQLTEQGGCEEGESCSVGKKDDEGRRRDGRW